MTTRWEVKKVLEIPGCLQWLWDGAPPARPTDKGKKPYASASTCGSWTCYGKTQGQLQTPHQTQEKCLLCSKQLRSPYFIPSAWLWSSAGIIPLWVHTAYGARGWGCPVRIWTPEGQEKPSDAALTHSVGLPRALCPGDLTAVVWPRGDEVMNNLSQVVIRQDEVESPCQLRMTETIIHGRSHVRGIQKYSKN